MAAVVGFDWVGWGATTWAVAQRAATSGLAFLAALPRNCALASAHAAMVCAERDVEYTTLPGFGPIAIGWGWLLLGILVGALLTLSLLTLAGKIKQEPSILQLAALMQPTAMAAPAAPLPYALVMTAQARADAMRYIALAGQPALRELATAARMSEASFLAHLTATEPHGAPGLTIHQ